MEAVSPKYRSIRELYDEDNTPFNQQSTHKEQQPHAGLVGQQCGYQGEVRGLEANGNLFAPTHRAQPDVDQALTHLLPAQSSQQTGYRQHLSDYRSTKFSNSPLTYQPHLETQLAAAQPQPAPAMSISDDEHQLSRFERNMATALQSGFQNMSIPGHRVDTEQDMTEDVSELYSPNRNNTVRLPLSASNSLNGQYNDQTQTQAFQSSTMQDQGGEIQKSQLYQTEQEMPKQMVRSYLHDTEHLTLLPTFAPVRDQYASQAVDPIWKGLSTQGQSNHRPYNSLAEPSFLQSSSIQGPSTRETDVARRRHTDLPVLPSLQGSLMQDHITRGTELHALQAYNPMQSNLLAQQYQQSFVPPQLQVAGPEMPSAHYFGHRRKPTNDNGVPYPEFICSVKLVFIPKDASLSHILRLIKNSGRVRSLEFIPGSTSTTQSASVIFTNPQGAHRLIHRSQTEGLRIGSCDIRALQGFIHIFSQPPIQPNQTRILLVGGWGETMKHPAKLIDFCRRHISYFKYVCVLPHTVEANLVEGSFYVWELHFAKIDTEAVKCREVLEKEEFHGQFLKVEFGMDPCEPMVTN